MEASSSGAGDDYFLLDLPADNLSSDGVLDSLKIEDSYEPTSSETPWDASAGKEVALQQVDGGLSSEPADEIQQRQRQLTVLMSEEEDSEYIHSSTWREQQHVFVLTEAGKPVYSRHGSEDKLSSIMGVMLALVSCVHDRNDVIRSIVAANHKFVFLIRIPLILVAVCSTSKTISQVKLHLRYVYDSILSNVPLSRLNRIYASQKNFDLRRLLTGTDKFLDHLCDALDSDPQYLLGAVKSAPLNSSVRDSIGQALQQAKAEDLVFAVLICSGKVVGIGHMKQRNLPTSDLQLLLNLVTVSSTSFLAGESWLPICLPSFNPSGYLHGHISYLDENLKTCLVLLSADKDAFFTLCECKKKVLAKLNRHNCLEALRTASAKAEYSVDKINIPVVRHFLYKSTNSSRIPYQYTSPLMTAPFHTPINHQRLFDIYQHLHGKIHNPSAPSKLHYCVSDRETLLAWVAAGFEIYVVFDPLVTKKQAKVSVDKLLSWIKRVEDHIFMTKTFVF